MRQNPYFVSLRHRYRAPGSPARRCRDSGKGQKCSLPSSPSPDWILYSQLPGNPTPAIAGFAINAEFRDAVKEVAADFDCAKAKLEAGESPVEDSPVAVEQRPGVRLH